MNHKEDKGKNAPPPSPNPAMAFDPAHLLGMHSMAAAGLPYAPMTPFPPSPYSLLGQPSPFPSAATAAMFGGLNHLNAMANPLHVAALSHSLAAAGLYGLPKQSGDLGSPPPPSSHLLPPPSSTPSSSSATSSSSNNRKGKSSSSSLSSSSKTAASSLSSLMSTHTPPSNSPSPSALALHSLAAASSGSAAFSPYDSAAAAAAAAAMHPYLPGWALNGSAYHMTQLANQMAEAHKHTESHHTSSSNNNKSSSSSSSNRNSSSNKSRSSHHHSSSSNSNSNNNNNNKPRTSSPSSSSSSRKTPPAAHQHQHQQHHQHENSRNSHHNHHNSHHQRSRSGSISGSGRSSASPSISTHHHHNVPMLNIPLSGSSSQSLSDKSESKKSTSASTSSSSSSSKHHHHQHQQQHHHQQHHQMGEGMEFDPRSMITPYQLSPELAYLSQSLLLHRPDLAALHAPFMTPPASSSSSSSATAATSSSLSSAHPTSSKSSSSLLLSTAETASQEPRSSSALSSSSSSSSLSSKRKKEESGNSGRSEREHQSKESEHHRSHHRSTKAATPTSTSSTSASASSTSTNLPFDLSQSAEQHSMDNIRKKKIADQIRKRMAGGGGGSSQDNQSDSQQQQQQSSSSSSSSKLSLQEQQQQQAMLDAMMSGGGLGMDLFAAAAAASASGYGLRQSDWLEYLAKEKSRMAGGGGGGAGGESSSGGGGGSGGKSSSSSLSQGKESEKMSAMSLEASLQQQEEELKELQKKYAMAMAGVPEGVMDLGKGSSYKSEAESETDNKTNNEDSMSGSDSDGSGRDTPKRGTDSADSSSPVKKRCYQTDERELVIPLEHGWNRQTVISGMGRRGIVGDVYYFAPCGKKLKTIPDVMRYIERNPNSDLGRENFSFNTKVNVGQFYEVRGGVTSSPVPLSDTEVLERIEMSRGKRARMQMLARKKREKVAREQALARQIMENKMKRKLELQDMSRRAAEMRFEKKLEKQHQKETDRKQKEDKALSKQKEKEQKQQERVRLQEQLRKEKELRAQQIIEARSRRQQELEEMRMADTVKRNQEREMKRQQLIMLKEQERERRRQHILLIKALEQRKKQEEKQVKERMREEKLNEKLKLREIRMSQRKVEMEVAMELKKPVEDMELKNRKPLPEFPRMEIRMAGRPVADCMMVVEFLNNFGSALNLDKNSLPTLQSLENGLMGDSEEEVEEVMSLVMHLLRFAIDDVGVPNPKEAVTMLNQKITEIEMTDSTMSEILRIFIKARGDKQLSEVLKEKPMEALNPTHKAAILAFLCNELLTSKVITGEIDKHMEGINNLRRDKWIVEGQLRQLRVYQAKKFNKIHRSTMDRRRNNSNSNSNTSGNGGGGGGGVGGVDGDDSMPPPGKLGGAAGGGGGGGSDEEEEEKDDDEGSGNESDGSTSAPISSANTNLNNMPFEPVDDTLTLEESDKRIENLQKQHLAYRQNVFRSSLRLRAINIGQDRYKRTFWILPLTGGVYVEGMESGEPEDYVEENERKIKKEIEEEERREREAKEMKEEEERKKKEVEDGCAVKEEGEVEGDVTKDVVKEEAGGEKEEKEGESEKMNTDDDVVKEGVNEKEGQEVAATEVKAMTEKSNDKNEKDNKVDNDDMNDEEDSVMDEGNNDEDDDDAMMDEDEEDNDVVDDDDDDNETSNMTGISENASWTDSDFNDSNMSFGGLKTSVSPVRSSSVKITVDMNGSAGDGGGHSDDDSSPAPSAAVASSSQVCKNLSLCLENGNEGENENKNEVVTTAASSSEVKDTTEAAEDAVKIVSVSSEEDNDLDETGNMSKNKDDALKLSPSASTSTSSPLVISNGKSHVDGVESNLGDKGDCETSSCVENNEKMMMNGEVDKNNAEGKQVANEGAKLSTLVDGEEEGKTSVIPSSSSSSVAENLVKVNGFGFAADETVLNLTEGSSAGSNCVDKSSNDTRALSVDVALNKVEKVDGKSNSASEVDMDMDGKVDDDKSKPSATSVCVDLSMNNDNNTDSPIEKTSPLPTQPSLPLSSNVTGEKTDQNNTTSPSTITKPSLENESESESLSANDNSKALPAADILRVPRIGQSRETSLFSILNHQTPPPTLMTTTATTSTTTTPSKGIDSKGAAQDMNGDSGAKAENSKNLSLLKPTNSILSSSLLFSPSSLSPTPTSSSSSSQPQNVATDLKISTSSSSSTSLLSPSHSSKAKKINGVGGQEMNGGGAVNLSADPSTITAPRPAHSKPINRQALPPFHPSAVSNPCLSQTPPAAHSRHAHDNKNKPPLHLSLKTPSRPTPPTHFHQTPPHSFNNPALSVNLYGDTTSASQALSSLASFASPPPAHQHRPNSSSLLTSTPKALTSTTTSTSTTSAASPAASSKSFKSPPAFSSIIDEVLKNEPEYSSSQLLHHAASQVRRNGSEKDTPLSLSTSSLNTPTPSSSKTPPLSKLPLSSSELSSLITSAILSTSSSSSPSSSSSLTTAVSDAKDDPENPLNNPQHPMWFSLLPRTPCDELSLTRQTNKSPAGMSSASSSSSTDLAAVAASLLLNSSSSSVTSLLNSLSTSSTSSSSTITAATASSPPSHSPHHSALSLENLLSLLQSNSPILSHDSPSLSPTHADNNSNSSCDFKVPQPPLDSSTSSLTSSPASSSMAMALNYDPWDLLRAAQGERQFIPLNKQHGWWRIFDLGQMKKIMSSTMNRGIREHNLQRAVQRYLDYARGHVTYDSSIGETDPNQVTPPKPITTTTTTTTTSSTTTLKRKSPMDRSASCSPVKKEKKSVQEKDDKMDEDTKEDNNDDKNEANNKKNENDTGTQSMDVDKEDDKTGDGGKDKNDVSGSSGDKVKQEEGEEGKEKSDGNVNLKIVKRETLEEGEILVEEGNDDGVKCTDDDNNDVDDSKNKADVKVKVEEVEMEEEEVSDYVSPDKEDCWSTEVVHEIEMAAVEDVEALEDRIYHASLQAKSGWKPNRETGLKMVDRTVKEVNDDESYPLDAGIARLLELEANVERRYLKPPLSRSVALNMSNMAGTSDNSKQQQDYVDLEEEEDVPPGLLLWRQAVIGSESPAQLSLCTQLLSKSISWEKSIMRVICQNCRKDDNEAELLLCDGCDKGFHTYCFKPKMENIPDGDWYCFECVTKASGTPHCGLCGNKGGRLAHCSKCPRYVHLDCLDPPLPRVPKRWQCANCLCDKSGSKRSRKRKESLPTVQRITKLVVKEEPVDVDDDLFPGEATLTSTSTPPPAPSSSLAFTIKEEPLSGGRKKQTTTTTTTTISADDANSSNSFSSSPPEKKRRKRKEKEPAATSSSSSSAVLPIDLNTTPPSSSSTPTTTTTLTTTPSLSNSNSPAISFTPVPLSTNSNTVAAASAAAASTTPSTASPKKKRQRKTKAERESEAAAAIAAAAAASASASAAVVGGGGGGVSTNSVEAPSPSISPVGVVAEKFYSEKERTKDLTNCGKLLGELDSHELGWPFLKPVNKKQFPSYKKYIKTPMDFTTIRNKLKAKGYKHRQDFATDVRLVFDNCETFNEDESEVGQAGHNLRQFFEKKFTDLFS